MSRVTIKELRLRNYRAFADARLVLDDITFLVGRNGAGKSTLMDAFSFVSEAVTDSLGTALERRGGLTALMTRQRTRRAGRVHRAEVSVAVCLQLESRPPIVYGFVMNPGPSGTGYSVKSEVLLGDPLASFRRDDDGFWTNTVSLQPVIDPETLIFPLIAGSNETWRSIIEALRLFSMHQFSPPAIRSEPKIGKDRRLSRDGQNAGDILGQLRPGDKRWVESWLAAAVPGIKGISVHTVVGRRVMGFVQAGENGEGQQFDASGMSDGTLRILGILLALRQSPRPSLVLLEEIEDSLHPLAHGLLLDAIDEASEEFPVVVSTHSPEILNHPTACPERIRVVQWSEGMSHIYRLGEGVRTDMKPPLTVGQLLRANALWTEEEPSEVGAKADFFELT